MWLASLLKERFGIPVKNGVLVRWLEWFDLLFDNTEMQEFWSSINFVDIFWYLQNGKACSHVYAAARDLGTQIYWDECDNSTIDAFVDHKCNIIQDEKPMNCKLYPTETNKSKDIMK